MSTTALTALFSGTSSFPTHCTFGCGDNEPGQSSGEESTSCTQHHSFLQNKSGEASYINLPQVLTTTFFASWVTSGTTGTTGASLILRRGPAGVPEVSKVPSGRTSKIVGMGPAGGAEESALPAASVASPTGESVEASAGAAAAAVPKYTIHRASHHTQTNTLDAHNTHFIKKVLPAGSTAAAESVGSAAAASSALAAGASVAGASELS